jgi:hypothetical protein
MEQFEILLRNFSGVTEEKRYLSFRIAGDLSETLKDRLPNTIRRVTARANTLERDMVVLSSPKC